jgi:hypothetical protein
LCIYIYYILIIYVKHLVAQLKETWITKKAYTDYCFLYHHHQHQ